MASQNLIGMLAIVTLLLVAAFTIYHFTSFLRDPRNRQAAENTLVKDEKSATAKVQEGQFGRSQSGETMKQRLDHSAASEHPDHPLDKKAGEKITI